MANEVKNEAQKVGADLDSAYSEAKGAEEATYTWVRAHTAWALGLTGFLLGWATRFIHL